MITKLYTNQVEGGIIRQNRKGKVMERKHRIKKRPCKVCRRWFRADPRVGEHQKTCGRPECKKEWHRRSCAKWNKKNSEYFRGRYLKNKMLNAECEKAQGKAEGSLPAPLCLGLPREEIQEAMGIKQAIIIDYIVKALVKYFQAKIKAQRTVKFVQMEQVPALLNTN